MKDWRLLSLCAIIGPMINKKKIAKWLGIAAASPFVLFLLMAILVYLPPVQNFVVKRVAAYMSETTGIGFSVAEVRLAFPLDLSLHGVQAVEKGDTLLDARSLRLHVQLMPLFEGQANVDGFELYDLKIDTKSYISDTRIAGTAGELTAEAHGIDWKKELVHINRARLRQAHILVALSDTAQKDTTPSTAKWRITVDRADIERSAVKLSMPGDSMLIGAKIGALALRHGSFDTGRGDYRVRKFRLAQSAVNYDLPFEKPTDGLDVNHLGLSQVGLSIDTLSYTPEGRLRLRLNHLTFSERSGFRLSQLCGNVSMDSTNMQLPVLNLRTPYSKLDASVAFDFRSFSEGKGGHCHLSLNGNLGREDILTLGKGYADAALLRGLLHSPLTVGAEVGGNIDHLKVERLQLQMPGVVQLQADGYVRHVLKDWRQGHVRLDLRAQRLAALGGLLPRSVARTVALPNRLTANGSVGFEGDHYAANLRVATGRGTLAAKAQANLRRESYAVTAKANCFPVAAFVKGLDMGPFSGNLRATGAGFDVLSVRSSLTADAKVDALRYATYDLSGIRLDARLRGGKAHASFAAENSLLTANGTVDATMGRSGYGVHVVADVPSVNLLRMGVTKDTLEVGTSIDIKAHANRRFTAYGAEGSIRGNHFTTPKRSTMAKDITFDFSTARDTTTAHISAGDLTLSLGAGHAIDRLADQCGRFATELSKQLDRRALDQETLKRRLPVMKLYVDAGRDNPIYNLARFKGYAFSSLFLNLNTDPARGMTGDARTGSLQVGGLLLDTINAHVLQDSTGVKMLGLVKNFKKKNPNPMEVHMKSYLLSSGAGMELTYLDAEGDKGVDLGVQANLVDGGLEMHLYPQHPVLAYRNFTVNKNNYIFLGKDKTIRADLDLLADDGTGLKIYSAPNDSVNDITVSVNRLNLGERSTVLPYLPQLNGMLSGDIHVLDDFTHKQFSAMASMEADAFQYEGTPLGRVGVEMVYLPKNAKEHHASAFISSNGEEVLACNGTYFDREEGYFEGDAKLHDFPMQMLNAFMVGTDVAFKGIAAGDVKMHGTFDRPVLNGSLDLDSAHIYSDVYGFDFRTDEREVEIKDSRLIFDNYNLYSTGKEPLVLNGTFDMSDFNRMTMDFTMKANNFELINTRKKAQSMVFGKVYTNYIGTLKGTTSDIRVRGKLDVLDRTDVTYILKDSPLSVDDRLHDLVQFVSFRDSTMQPEKRQAVEGGFDLSLGISVSDAAQFHCNLSDDGQSYVDLEGGGDLTLRMTQSGDMRLTGRFTANSGEMKYALPVIPLKTFQLVQGSSVEFTGDVMNPTLDIAAKERTKAVVTEDDKQRSVAFDVGVKITKPLNEMGLEFTIEAPEDLNIQNQLASMSAEQRGKTAVTMMATGMYMTDETMMSGSGFKANNALNAFLQSEIQNIAGSALKTIDINLGVESGTSAKGTNTTDYSFQFAKRFWGNRISVIIGGKVSTGADAENSAESFINNISVEYRLDQSASRYVKVFYDRETQDPLEGQLTKTGAGLVLKRKTNRLGELFIFRRKK